MAANMAFFWDRPVFHRRPKKGRATIVVDLRSACTIRKGEEA